MRPHRASTFAAAFFVASLASSSVHAQARKPRPKPAAPAPAPAAEPPAPAPEPPAPSAPSLADTLTGDAKADYEAGKLLYGDGDNAGALVKFTAAYEKAKDPRLLWNMAACEKNLRHYSSVLALVRRYLSEGDTLLTPADKSEAETLIKAIEPLTVSLDLSVTEPGAKVFVDEKLVGETPLPAPVVVDIGLRRIRVQKEGFEEYKEDLTAGDSPKVKLVAKLEKVVHEATLSVTARPRDEISLDGTVRGLGTWKGIVPSGGHTLRVTAPEMRTYQAEIFLRDRETRNVTVTLEKEVKPAGPVPTWLWIGGGALLLGGAAVAGYFVFKPEDRPAETPVGTLDPGSVQASFPFGAFGRR